MQQEKEEIKENTWLCQIQYVYMYFSYKSLPVTRKIQHKAPTASYNTAPANHQCTML
jgi:hypothetical protein